MSKHKRKDDNFEPNGAIDIRDYIIYEAEEDHGKSSTKRKADNKPAYAGRPSKKAKYEFTAEDKKLLLEGAQKYGTSYASIQKEYFNEKEPAVTRNDIANEFKKSKFLSQAAAEAHKKLKDHTKKKFIESFEEPQSLTENVETKPHATLNEPFKLFEYNDNFRFVYFLRLNLTEDVDVHIDEKNRTMDLEIRAAPFLTEDEKKQTNLLKFCDFNVTLKEEEAIKRTTVRLPDDAILESIERFDNDTEYGWLLELQFKRKEKIDSSKLVGKRFGHMRTSSITNIPLYRPENSMVIDRYSCSEEDDENNDK